MAGNSFGTIFKITTWGESHGPALGVVIDGCPAGLKITVEEIQKEMDRRKPGQSPLTSSRKERDVVKILSGVFSGTTTGTPINLMIENHDHENRDYEKISDIYRPSHADFTYDAKYGLRDPFGGGRASARETATRVAAGAFAKKILRTKNVEIMAYVKQINNISSQVDLTNLQPVKIENSPVRCPDKTASKKMVELIEAMKDEGDSVGGVIECLIRQVPVGLGSPVFDKLEARLAHAMLSLPATKGFEIGSGFTGVLMKGSEHNDILVKKDGVIMTRSNHAGGTVGGISNGMDIIFRVAFKPTSTIKKGQKTIKKNGEVVTLKVEGRHDTCVLPRAVPIVEAMAALVLIDEYLIQKSVQLKNFNHST